VSVRGQIFADDWVADNLASEMHLPDDVVASAKKRAKALLAAARTVGISRDQIEEEVGPIIDFIVEAIESSADSEVARLAGKTA
jgi:hypothetical protein